MFPSIHKNYRSRRNLMDNKEFYFQTLDAIDRLMEENSIVDLKDILNILKQIVTQNYVSMETITKAITLL